MRDNFLKALLEVTKKDQNIFLITGDLGFKIFDNYIKKFKNRFLNVGVAEQNMTMIASGMALEGKKVFTYSIGNFPTLRCLEQIRNDICYHNLDVKIVSIGGGFSYGSLGMSHHSTEDLSIMRALPNMIVIAPGSLDEVKQATKHIVNYNGPAYLRLDKSFAENKLNSKFKIGKADLVMKGNDLTLICAGGILEEVILTANQLKKEGVNARILSMHTIKPLDKKSIRQAAIETKKIITVEENNINGGLGSAVAEYLLDEGFSLELFYRVAIDDVYSSIVGDQKYLRKKYSIDNKSIYKKIKQKI